MSKSIPLAICALLAAGSALLSAQHGYTPADAEEGEQLFIENCAICHGPEGDAVPGVELARRNPKQWFCLSGSDTHSKRKNNLVGAC